MSETSNEISHLRHCVTALGVGIAGLNARVELIDRKLAELNAVHQENTAHLKLLADTVSRYLERLMA